MTRNPKLGFTLAEVLISLMILGEIAAFTIPKIFTSQQTQRYNAIAKEIISTLAAAHQKAQQNGLITTSGSMKDLSQYMNYLSVDTSSLVDGYPGGPTSILCAASVPCLKLQSGAMVRMYATAYTTTSLYTYALIDPDGGLSGARDSLFVVLYYNGRITTYETVNASNPDPTWFSW